MKGSAWAESTLEGGYGGLLQDVSTEPHLCSAETVLSSRLGPDCPCSHRDRAVLICPRAGH